MNGFLARLALSAVALTAACGGEEPKAERPKDDPPPAKKDGADGVDPDAPIPNPQWDKLKGFYLGTGDASTGFVRSQVQSLRDPFELQLGKYVERVEFKMEDYGTAPPTPEEPAEGADGDELTGGSGTVPEMPPCETCRFRAQDYRLLLIRWGSAVNKAVVVDPEGESYVIAKDMPFGNNQGRVADIQRYEVFIAEDSQEEPIVLSIRPDLLKQSADENSSDRLFLQRSGAR